MTAKHESLTPEVQRYLPSLSFKWIVQLPDGLTTHI